MTIDGLKRQHTIERLSREAEKIVGITTALDLALTTRSGDTSEISWAFDAIADIARKLAKDLEELSDDECGEHHHVGCDAVEDQDVKGTCPEIGDSGIHDAVQTDTP